ncbi:YgaC family protein [Microbacterium gorillae]|uniref:YgaC family protein n=1 Tax=Microbacterium gorillae TaxID=1231063 RepID=UPI00058E80BD|nr:YgaC family protein [Microbacterium gorillae]
MQTRPGIGTPVRVAWRKWDGAPHWQHDTVYLGSDEHGDWVGQFSGTRSTWPGHDSYPSDDVVRLIPSDGRHLPMFNGESASYEIYVDIGWDIGWDTDDEITGIDMDLDIIRARDDRGVWVDDRDEWDEHRESYGYPAAVQESLEAHVVEVLEAVRSRTAPFDGPTAERWLRRLRDLPGTP